MSFNCNLTPSRKLIKETTNQEILNLTFSTPHNTFLITQTIICVLWRLIIWMQSVFVRSNVGQSMVAQNIYEKLQPIALVVFALPCWSDLSVSGDFVKRRSSYVGRITKQHFSFHSLYVQMWFWQLDSKFPRKPFPHPEISCF